MKKRPFPLGRLLYVALFVAIQIAALVVMFAFFANRFAYFYLLCLLLALAASVHLINSPGNPAYKIAWLIPLYALPIFGGLLYLMFGFNRSGRIFQRLSRAMRERSLKAGQLLPGCDTPPENPDAAAESRYIQSVTGSPAYVDSGAEYFCLGDEMYPRMLEDLRSAKRFIFMEYFIVERGVMWNGILDILTEKAREGVDVRVMYDDLGCLMKLPRHYDRELSRRGIKAVKFNPFNTILSPRFNNRDHRKITVIDGEIGYTGGVNLADEYINIKSPYGHWKDTGVRLTGKIVFSLTSQFLAAWDQATGKVSELAQFLPQREFPAGEGRLQFYSDVPADDEPLGENAYLHLINRAKKYVWITTPYLVIGNEMMTALRTAAKSGVDVRIITPHIGDHKAVFFLTRSYYGPLIEAGVKVYEYTPGFIHAKSMVTDDHTAIVGTINLDYRSLYLHMECAVWMHGVSAVADVKRDFLDTEALSAPPPTRPNGRMTWLKQIFLSLLRAFSPLL